MPRAFDLETLPVIISQKEKNLQGEDIQGSGTSAKFLGNLFMGRILCKFDDRHRR